MKTLVALGLVALCSFARAEESNEELAKMVLKAPCPGIVIYGDPRYMWSDMSSNMKVGGEIWGGALWELRGLLGRERADRLVLATWKQLRPDVVTTGKISAYVDAFVTNGRSIVADVDSDVLRRPFARRNLR